jgi:hypothetical protein
MTAQATRLALILFGAGAYLGLAVLGEGGFARFFSNPALETLAIILLAATLVTIFAGGNLASGVREDRSNRWTLAVFVVLSLADGYFPTLGDRLGLWIIGVQMGARDPARHANPAMDAFLRRSVDDYSRHSRTRRIEGPVFRTTYVQALQSDKWQIPEDPIWLPGGVGFLVNGGG